MASEVCKPQSQSSSWSANFPKIPLDVRPGSGRAGRPIMLVANHHRVRFADNKTIYHYDVSIQPEPRKGSHFHVMRQAFSSHEDVFGKVPPAYDGNRSFFTVNPLDAQHVPLEIVASEDPDDAKPRNRKFNLTIRHVSEISMTKMRQYLEGKTLVLPQEILQAMDLALRQIPRRYFVEKGRSFFNDRFGRKVLDNCLEAHCGFYQSIRPAQNNLLTLNIDIAALPLLQQLPLPVFISEFFRKDLDVLNDTLGRNDNEGAVMRSKLGKLLKQIRVETSHTGHKYKIARLTDRPISILTFNSKEGEELSVVDYFKTQYSIDLRLTGFPAIEAGSKEKKRYIPIELCRICANQPFIKALNDVQRSVLLALTCMNPEERRQQVEKISRELREAVGPYLANFGIEINSLLTSLPGRLLDPPKICYKSNMETPRDGTWNMRGKVIYKGTKISSWTVVNFSNVNKGAVISFCQMLAQECDKYGVKMNPNVIVPPANETGGNIEGVLRYQKSVADKNASIPLELIICIMPQRDNKYIYAIVKKVCELELGVVTQCCLADHVQKSRPEYIANVILKINAKLGGQNASLEEEQKRSFPLISGVPSMIIGADVSHSRVGEEFGASISAVVASMDWPSFSKYKAMVCSQKRGSELFEHLYWETEDEEGRKQTGGIFKDLLLAFREQSGNIPQRILYYRDGVSDGQFEMVLNNEMGSLRKALEALGWSGNAEAIAGNEPSLKRIKLDQPPKITFVVAQKRHHTRFFPDLRQRCPTLRNGNIPPGTVVDTVVCHPKLFDFYLCSHAGIKGTSKPTHYNVLKDENRFSADELEKLTNDLCFMYARCTRSVSVVPACYYAHLAAKRGRLWIDSDNQSDSGSVHSRSSTVSGSKPLAPVHDKIKESMFYI